MSPLCGATNSTIHDADPDSDPEPEIKIDIDSDPLDGVELHPIPISPSRYSDPWAPVPYMVGVTETEVAGEELLKAGENEM